MPHGRPNRIAEYLDGSQWTQSDQRPNVRFVLLENLKRPPNLCTDISAPCRLVRARYRSVQSDELCRFDSAPENGESHIGQAVQQVVAAQQDAYLYGLQIGLRSDGEQIRFRVLYRAEAKVL